MKSFESWLTTVDAFSKVVIRLKEKNPRSYVKSFFNPVPKYSKISEFVKCHQAVYVSCENQYSEY